MAGKGWLAIIGMGMVLGSAVLPYGALAQPGYYVTPSFGFTQLYNDNVLYTPSNRRADFITRLSPGIVAGYESAPLTLLGGYTFDGEIFAHNTDLNEAMARQKASLDFRYLPNRALTLSMKGEYTETQTPGEINVLTGLPTERRRGDTFLVDPSVEYRFDRLNTGRVAYTFTKDDFSGLTADTHVGRIGVDRRITSRDTGSLEYVFRQFVFKGETVAEDTVRAYSIVPGWTHELTRLMSFTLRAGPRFSEGSVDADVLALVRYRPTPGDVSLDGDATEGPRRRVTLLFGPRPEEVSLAYARSQTTALGVGDTIRTNSVTLRVRYRVLPLLEVTPSASYFRSTLAGSRAEVYRAALEAAYEFTQWLSLVGSYEHVFQNGILAGTPGLAGVAGRHRDISNNIFMLSLVARYRTRLY